MRGEARRSCAAAPYVSLPPARRVRARACTGWVPEVPEGERIAAGSTRFFTLEKAGMEVVGQTGFVLVAGGLGERLGYNGIKIALPCDTATGKSYMQWYAEYILAFQARACRAGRKIPLAIMTSDDTHEKTAAFLEQNGYFGLAREQVTLMKQEKVPSLVDNSARFGLSADDPYSLETKPHGHGDVHSLMWTQGVASAWHKAGIKYVAFFQDTNALAFRAFPAMLGVSAKCKFEYNSLTVPRTAGEAVGGIAKLRHTDGRTMTLNVEYNQLDPLLRATVNPQGDVPDEHGCSPYPGNINVLVLELGPYRKTLEATSGQMPEFVNPKYKDSSKDVFSKPTRLECMMQDYPRLLPQGARVGFTQLDRWIAFSPVKNNAQDAAKKAAAGTPPESASTGEADMYNACCTMLDACGARRAAPVVARSARQRLTSGARAAPRRGHAVRTSAAPRAGMTIERDVSKEYLGVPVSLAPMVHLSPAFAPTWSELLKKVKGGRVSARSALIVDGEATLRGLELDGALVLRPRYGASVKIDSLKETNDGWAFVELPQNGGAEPEEIKMRGYKLEKKSARTIAFSDGKEHKVLAAK